MRKVSVHASRHTFIAGVAVLAAGTLAGCSSAASGRAAASASGSSTTVAQVTVPATIPAGTTLRVGDQLNTLQTSLKIGGQDQNFPYKVQYSSFVGGPPMLQAFQASAIDVGVVGSTPLIFAQAAKQQIHAVAGSATQSSSYALVLPPGKTGINGWADLKGKKVAFQQGTALEAALLEGLDTVGLKYSDVTPVNLPSTQIAQALQGGSADAGVLAEPLTSVYLAANPTAKVVAKTNEIADRSAFLIATQSAVDDPGKTAALADYITRLVKAYGYEGANPQAVIQGVYVNQYHLPAARAAAIVNEIGASRFVQLPGDVVKSQQRLADLFFAAGEIPSTIDVSTEFDARFNDIVSKAGGA